MAPRSTTGGQTMHGIPWAQVKALALAACLLAVTFALHGCADGSCMWNGDIMVKGCRYQWFFDWNDCIEGCNACGDECNKLKCAAFCAKQSGDDTCLSSYQALCSNAVQHVPRVAGCDVDCSGAPPRRGPGWLLVLGVPALVAYLVSQDLSWSQSVGRPAVPGSTARPAWQGWSIKAPPALILVVLLAATLSLSGCCSDPAPQIPTYQPDGSEFNRLANRIDESGIWRGNAFQYGAPGFINEQQFKCTKLSGDVCHEWTRQERNCHEKTFGMCTCQSLSAAGKYCQKWSCKNLEADQFVCHYVHRCEQTSSSRRRGHRRLVDATHVSEPGGPASDVVVLDMVGSAENEEMVQPMYQNGSEAPASSRRLGTSCHWAKECVEAQMEMTESKYRMILAEQTKFQSFSGVQRFWALVVHDPSIWGWFQTQALCITPGDFMGSTEEQYHDQMQYCHGQAWFREIEEEMLHCTCKEPGAGDAHCNRWRCMETKSGLFGLLFETAMPHMEDYVEGELVQEFQCDTPGSSSRCGSWSGKMKSWKEADMAKCQCSSTDCSSWVCDEYKIMVMQNWVYYLHLWIPGLLLMGMQCFFSASLAGAGRLGQAGVLMSIGGVFSLLVFYVLGLWGFLFLCVPCLLMPLAVVGLRLAGKTDGSEMTSLMANE